MNKKIALYSLVTLLTGIAITGFSITNSAKADEKNQTQPPCPMMTAQTHGGMGMRTQVDRHFIEKMIPHHQDAIDMANMALNRAKNPEVKQLAQSIIKEQTRENEQMRAWYQQWYGTEVPKTGTNMGMHAQMGRGMGMMMRHHDRMGEDMMATLENASDFDQEFLRQMTHHHRMALMMAGMVVNRAEHPEIRNLAQSIIESQTAEINEMQQLLARARKR